MGNPIIGKKFTTSFDLDIPDAPVTRAYKEIANEIDGKMLENIKRFYEALWKRYDATSDEEKVAIRLKWGGDLSAWYTSLEEVEIE